MKIIKTVVLFLILIFAPMLSGYSYELNGILNGDEVYYSPERDSWSNEVIYPDSITYVKKNSDGLGAYSIYFSDKGGVAFFLGSDYEFIKDGRLISSHNSQLNFYEVIYLKGSFSEVKLSEDEVRDLFPDLQMVKISDFKNNALRFRKKTDTLREFLIYNDTDKDFYNFKFYPFYVNKNGVKGILSVKNANEIKFTDKEEEYIIRLE